MIPHSFLLLFVLVLMFLVEVFLKYLMIFSSPIHIWGIKGWHRNSGSLIGLVRWSNRNWWFNWKILEYSLRLVNFLWEEFGQSSGRWYKLGCKYSRSGEGKELVISPFSMWHSLGLLFPAVPDVLNTMLLLIQSSQRIYLWPFNPG